MSLKQGKEKNILLLRDIRGYYYAKILLIADTEEELQKIIEKKQSRKFYISEKKMSNKRQKSDHLNLAKLEEDISFNNEEDFYLNEERMRAVSFRVKDGYVGDSMFVKNLACALFGTDVLIRSSVAGGKCNVKKDAVAKPALCSKRLAYVKKLFTERLKKEMCSHEEMIKRLSKMNCFIAEKIITLLRKN